LKKEERKIFEENFFLFNFIYEKKTQEDMECAQLRAFYFEKYLSPFFMMISKKKNEYMTAYWKDRASKSPSIV
jgi:capsule polysaccharide export protein KpsE/RkpR